MKFHDYNVVIEYKKIKHLYIRIKDPKIIYITCNRLTNKLFIKNYLKQHELTILKMINKHEQIKHKEQKFYYLGTKYNVVYTDTNKVVMDTDNIYAKDKKMLDRWLKKQIKHLFSSRLEICYNVVNFKCPYPNLKIRTMKTRWGVCHSYKKTITLNSKLIRYDYDVIDYVIIHELCHFKHAHHQSSFWDLVGVYIPDYKEVRKKLKE